MIGASGLLGSKILVKASDLFSVTGSCNPDADGKNFWRLEPLDIGSKDQVERLFEKHEPELVILCAAMTNVDACEKQPQVAIRINATGPELVARSCKKHGARLVHVSTDYVFDGLKSRKYTEGDVPRPISVYGSSKLAGEKAVLSTLPGSLVVRTAILYGWSPLESRGNFVTWVLSKFKKGERAMLFSDQRISPTYADDLADALIEIANMDIAGLIHVSGPDCLDRPTCGRMIARVFGFDEGLVVPTTSDTVSLPAKRPKYSCLDVSKAEKLLNRKTVSFEEGLRAMKLQEDSRK